ncbi:tRNA lysidine(34) synthetase TilS [Tsukamurella tyrosinosolvens]|uniref:tRNA lysidine(34) synthetase TilS n=1 Tax=Tsukamurella tyrosinosolvens TaxID=57704 RepID=UPI00079184DC|nr:tRNA lysidine(34) synthetase TilS [Tsukamurella tyrosinosolvens]AUN39090.1 tRNA lysidine(34) synthetase TilS [Tsukamurella tyrosinosolvens]KXP02346.1 tRNA(Ile)-lysidine synthetase [Tsukamurella tyrosinosolvens]MCA4996369.1 tRNA lysidine(34) synthetase TilS [Tsukamurella tyrosinosolvens]WEL93745.1 tRNA lysidine(34) synthetase TilS [Tsukamurella tyrosinosolvens]
MDRPGPVNRPGPAALRVRHAVRAWRTAHGSGPTVAVALSGGADSLALLTGALAEGLDVVALAVDHGLQEGSAAVAERAAATARELGARATVLTVTVSGPGGPEAAARAARYAALDAARDGAPVLLGHTLDDQAETVLLGLGRGSGARSLAGMAAWAAPYGRPLLGVRRADTRAACAELGLTPWEDPHNLDPRYTRVRVRTEVLPLLEDVLGGGVAESLARTAASLRADNDALDGLAPAPSGPDLPVEELAGLPAALRIRALRTWLAGRGARALTGAHLAAVDALVTDWHGQGPTAIPGGSAGRRLQVHRAGGILRAW